MSLPDWQNPTEENNCVFISIWTFTISIAIYIKLSFTPLLTEVKVIDCIQVVEGIQWPYGIVVKQQFCI